MSPLNQVQEILRYRAAHDAWFAKLITETQFERPFKDPEPKLEDFVSDMKPPQPPEFPIWCDEVANAVGPALTFTNGNVRMAMTNKLFDIYTKYVNPKAREEEEALRKRIKHADLA